MKKLLAMACVLGTVLPFSFAAPFFMEQGLNLPLLFELLWANSISRFFAVDLVISSFVFLVWSFDDAKKNAVPGWWIVLIANLCAGLSLALPLYLYRRQK